MLLFEIRPLRASSLNEFGVLCSVKAHLQLGDNSCRFAWVAFKLAHVSARKGTAPCPGTAVMPAATPLEQLSAKGAVGAAASLCKAPRLLAPVGSSQPECAWEDGCICRIS